MIPITMIPDSYPICHVKPIFHCGAKLLALGQPPYVKIHVGDTNMLESKNAKICANLEVANPQCKSVEYRLCCFSWRLGSHWACIFHVVCAAFYVVATRNIANTNANSIEIQALLNLHNACSL